MGQEQKLAEQQGKTQTSFYRASADADPPAQKDWETTMNTRQNVKSVSSIAQQLNAVQLSSQQRNEVLHAALVAELFVDAVVWICSKAQQLAADVREADAEVLGR